ncbi:transcriptional regulator [Streptomyces sp. NPDC005393]|uniref:transcriptional regulator n=1 Tax=Streptomyces sp. NPDC005393 TaxID=3157041 RepID=UPI0033BD9997
MPAPPISSVAASPDEAPTRAIVAVTIATLLPGESPRSEGPDQEHVARLAEVDTPLPPILVRRSDMRVIDGMHRLLAALIRGQTSIDVEFFEGSPADSFLLAVRANIAHGLPLSQADRRAAASRIIASHPQMSDRAIAQASGLGAKAIATIRRRSSDDLPQLSIRVGRDGRARPLNSVDGRWRAAELMAENPQASLREVARLAKISPATVSDVRKRIQSGKLPATVRPHADHATPEVTHPTESRAGAEAAVRVPAQGKRLRPERRARTFGPDPAVVLDKLLRDPSLRLKEEGRYLLRLLQQNASAEWYQLTEAVPPHCGELVGSLARQYAAIWLEFAQHLEERDRAVPQRASY